MNFWTLIDHHYWSIFTLAILWLIVIVAMFEEWMTFHYGSRGSRRGQR